MSNHRKRTLAAIFVPMLMVLIGLWAWQYGAKRRAVGDLPATERSEILARELESFRVLCGPTPRRDALEAECRRLATLLSYFPECDDDCRAYVKVHLPRVRETSR